MKFLSEEKKDLLTDIVLSIIIAFTIWLGVSLTKRVPKEIVLSVPVQFKNVPDNIEIVNFTPTVNVKLSGPSSIISSITPQEIQVLVDVSNLKGDGEHIIKIKKRDIVVPQEGLLKEPVTKTITVNILELGVKRVKVYPQVIAYAETGYKVLERGFSPRVIRIKGPLKIIKRISYLKTEKVIKKGLKKSMVFEVQIIIPKDVVSLDGDIVRYEIKVEKAGGKKI